MLGRGNEGYEVDENEVKEMRRKRRRKWEESENMRSVFAHGDGIPQNFINRLRELYLGARGWHEQSRIG